MLKVQIAKKLSLYLQHLVDFIASSGLTPGSNVMP